jgi:D-3-phosphoglycerate dehydrogenase
VRLHEGAQALTADALVKAAAGADVIVSDRNTPGPAAVFEGLPELAAFVRCAVDIRNVDVPAASAAGTLVTHASPGFGDAVTELVLGFMIDLGRRVSESVIAYRDGREADAGMGRQLAESTLGVIGYGVIGRRLAKVATFLGMQVLVSDPYKTVDDPGVRQVELAELLASSDFVVCLAIANEATENLIDAAALARMQPHAYFINVSRGGLVDEAALAAALDAKQIAGAAMDVGRAPDQKPSPALARRGDVIATPHIGGATPPAIAHQALETVRQVAEIVQGRAPEGAANADKATKLARLAGGR